MLRLKLVKTPAATTDKDDNDNNNADLLHGTQVVKQLIEPWFNSNRVVCADSAFASIGCAVELKRLGMRFIGVVKLRQENFQCSG